MADEKDKTGTPDNDLINLNQSYEVRHWRKALGCTETQLRASVAAVGNSARKVREFLAKYKR
jgi:hypothetical protein